MCLGLVGPEGRAGPPFAEATDGRLPAVPVGLSPLFRAASFAVGVFCEASFGVSRLSRSVFPSNQAAALGRMSRGGAKP